MNPRPLLRATLVLGVGLFVTFASPSCGPSKTDCASTCKGCCSADGVCDAFGDSAARCGTAGALCKACTQGQACLAGVCSSGGTGGGGGASCTQQNCAGCCDAAA